MDESLREFDRTSVRQDEERWHVPTKRTGYTTISEERIGCRLCILYNPRLRVGFDELSMRRNLLPTITLAIGFWVSFLVFVGGTGLKGRARTVQATGPAGGAVLVHKEMKYDVSPRLAPIQGTSDRASAGRNRRGALLACEGAGCGNSPGASSDDLKAVAEQRPEEPIPPPAPLPTLSPAGVAIEQT